MEETGKQDSKCGGEDEKVVVDVTRFKINGNLRAVIGMNTIVVIMLGVFNAVSTYVTVCSVQKDGISPVSCLMAVFAVISWIVAFRYGSGLFLGIVNDMLNLVNREVCGMCIKHHAELDLAKRGNVPHGTEEAPAKEEV